MTMLDEFKALDILHCQCAGVSSRSDGSLTVKITTPEMLSSQAGWCMKMHGKNIRVTLIPEDTGPTDVVTVDTERETKTASQRFRSVLFVAWKEQVEGTKPGETFDEFYQRQYLKITDFWKARLPEK